MPCNELNTYWNWMKLIFYRIWRDVSQCVVFFLLTVKFTVYCSTCVKSVKSAINVPIAAPFTTVHCNCRHSWHLWFSSWDPLRSCVSPRWLALENNAHRFAQMFQVHDISSVSLQCLHWCLLCRAHTSRTVKDKKGQLSYFSDLCQILPVYYQLSSKISNEISQAKHINRHSFNVIHTFF